MKKITALLAVLILLLSMSSCTKQSEDVPGSSSPSVETEDASENALDGSYTFKSAIESQPRIWFGAEDIQGGSTIIDTVIYFTGGEATVYTLRLHHNESSEKLGRLKEYVNLSDEEALSLAAERYKAYYKNYYDLYAREESMLSEMEKFPENFQNADELKANLEEAYAKLQAHEVGEKAPSSYSLFMMTNGTDSAVNEIIEFPITTELIYKGQIRSTSPTPYEVFSSEDRAFPMSGADALAPFEVGGVCYGGFIGSIREAKFNAAEQSCSPLFFTKCTPETTFTLDSPDEEGIEVIN